MSQYSYKAKQYESLDKDSSSVGDSSTVREKTSELTTRTSVSIEDITFYREQNERLLGVIERMSDQSKTNYDLRGAKFGGGFAAENGVQVGGSLIDFSTSSNLAEAASQIQELLQQLHNQGVDKNDAEHKAAEEIIKQAGKNPALMSQLVQWGKSLADSAGKTTVSEASKVVLKLALQMAGIAIP